MTADKPALALVGGGPMALMLALEYVRQALPEPGNPEKLILISAEPWEKLGFGEVLDTVHPEVVFNVAAGKMSLDPDPRSSSALVSYWRQNEIPAKSLDFIREANHATELAHQFLPRLLL